MHKRNAPNSGSRKNGANESSPRYGFSVTASAPRVSNTVSAYAAAKGGLKMLTRNMATEWAKYNIQINGIGPGYFATAQTEPIRVDGHPFNEFIINRTPAGRWGDPEDLAGTAVFLASKAADFVNGQVVYVDGGILATIGKPSNEE